ncbi:MAG: hypothetical protein ACK4SZ_06875 [Allosphingosinicella sp.]|uniref:hypothetical protein n=1 Tax=Allosphingosinicella sp. TaxID=2823234 RepID=UPI003938B2FA
MNEQGFAFDESIPLDRFQGAEVEQLVVGTTALTLLLSGDRCIHLDYQGCLEERGSWLCSLPLCGEHSLMSLTQQTITVEFASADRAFIHLSGGGKIDLVRDAPGVDLVRFCIGQDEYQA